MSRINNGSLGKGHAPGEPVVTITEALAWLLASIQAMVLPAEIWKMPYLDDGGAGTKAATTVGGLNGGSNPADDLSRSVKMPDQGTVVKYVMELLEVIGQRAYAILAALSTGTLTMPFMPTSPARGWWKTTSWRTKVLLAVSFVLEAVFGSKMAERLAGSSDYISWAVGLAIAAVLTVSAISIAEAIQHQQLGLLRGYGAWAALGVAVLGVLFLTTYAWGLGGGAEAQPTISGLNGGAAPDSAVTSGPSENWALIVIYASLLLFLLTSVVLSHLIDLFHEDVARVDKDMAAKKAVLPPEGQKRLAIELLTQCVVLIEQAKHRVRGLIQAYIGGVRLVLPPALNSAWNTDALENLELPDPAWVKDIKEEIARLTREVGGSPNDDGDDNPPLALVPAS